MQGCEWKSLAKFELHLLTAERDGKMLTDELWWI